MFKVTVTNVASGVNTHGAIFATESEAQQWIAQQISKTNCAWGKPEHLEEILDENGLSFDPPQYETIPSEFEVEITDITAELEAEAAKQARIAAGKAAREACLKVLDMVAGYNLERELTIEQITSMAATLGQPMQALQAGRPGLAKQLIQTITADEVVTQEMIDEALELLSEY